MLICGMRVTRDLCITYVLIAYIGELLKHTLPHVHTAHTILSLPT